MKAVDIEVGKTYVTRGTQYRSPKRLVVRDVWSSEVVADYENYNGDMVPVTDGHPGRSHRFPLQQVWMLADEYDEMIERQAAEDEEADRRYEIKRKLRYAVTEVSA